MDSIDSKPAKAKKTRIKLRARTIEIYSAPGGDLTKMKRAFIVEVLKSRKWEWFAKFDILDEAQTCKEGLDGLEVDIS